MTVHVINLILDGLFGGLALYRIHRGDLYESGTLLRVGIFLLAMWRAFGDIHEITGFFNDENIHSLHYGPFRDMVSEIILFIALALDMLREWQRKRSIKNTHKLINDVKGGER